MAGYKNSHLQVNYQIIISNLGSTVNAITLVHIYHRQLPEQYYLYNTCLQSTFTYRIILLICTQILSMVFFANSDVNSEHFGGSFN